MEWLGCLKNAIKFIEDNLENDIDVVAVANAVFVSPFYLQKGFRIVTGYSIGEYIRNRRLYKAALDIAEGATIETVKAAAKAARVDRFIDSLPDGYDTVLTDEGVNISKGQRQLITIARAMLSESKMLILDEATSNVDSRTEIKIQEAMAELMKGRTCFVIAHRLSTIQNADRIYVIQNGMITESGNHTELLEKHGFYSTLYNSQFS